MRLGDVAHARTGDKGNISNISVIFYKKEDYYWAKERLTASCVKSFFQDICQGKVMRYELDQLYALNFVLEDALSGGVTRSLALDKHGKSLSSALLEIQLK